ncbi:flagellar hook-associated protein FlgL [Paenibacillus physcomitrellae]|uniref:Flagellar hook-associated protein FlgL n=1 Tax=Paenibacillus physcomitrellae TaxID=1619311 RepID=A0ABQ1GGX8_9BACL|nr:flagellar hook-associated protein FlgL [Paenibacillus physcomitrellae]GGA43688.1 flagellar hook-associated protein FlgL [Paenibacillus physcomitrellae]
MQRITNNMLSSQLLLNINRNSVKMSDMQTQMATGRKINKPSDDPVGITYSLRYRSELSSNEQYQKNVDSSVSWLDYNDTVMSQAGDVVQRIRELTVQAGTGTNPQSSLDSINEEIGELKEQLIDIANSTLNGKYVFNGQKYTDKPFVFPKNEDGTSNTDDLKTVMDQIDQGPVNYTVSAGVSMTVNITSNDVFGNAEDQDNIFNIINNISTALAKGDISSVSAQLDNIDTRSDKMLSVRAEVGAKTNRIELLQNRLSDMETNLTDLQSKTEDADYAQLIMNSQIQENIYNASLSAGAKIISPSLADFLK